jgi:hypothetical protein
MHETAVTMESVDRTWLGFRRLIGPGLVRASRPAATAGI